MMTLNRIVAGKYGVEIDIGRAPFPQEIIKTAATSVLLIQQYYIGNILP